MKQWNLKEAAAYVGMSVSTARRLINQGAWPEPTGRRGASGLPMWSTEALDRFMVARGVAVNKQARDLTRIDQLKAIVTGGPMQGAAWKSYSLMTHTVDGRRVKTLTATWFDDAEGAQGGAA